MTLSKYQRRLQLFHGDKLLDELFLGTSPSYRNIHARVAGEDKVYEVKLAKFDFAIDGKEWFDRAMLRLDKVTAVSGPDFEVKKSGATWSLVSSGVQPVTLDQQKLNKLPELFGDIWIQDVAESLPEENRIIISVSDDEKTLSYHFAKTENDYLVKRSDLDRVFKIRKKDYETVAEWNLDHLTLTPAASTTDAGIDAVSEAENKPE